MTDWRWIAPQLVFAIPGRQLSEHGGSAGIRDRELILSALARPQNLAVFSDPDAAALAAAYAFGLLRNHGFVDGDKRTAWVVVRLFLADNGYRLRFASSEAVRAMRAAAAGEITEDALADWLRERIVEKQRH